MHKRCTECGETKHIDDFASAGLGKKRAKCKPCLARKKREYYKKNPDKARRRNLKTLYNLSNEEWDDMAQRQNYCCAICRKSSDTLHTDHSHLTNKVRGLLCVNCNLLLGHAKDSLEIISNAQLYLIEHND